MIRFMIAFTLSASVLCGVPRVIAQSTQPDRPRVFVLRPDQLLETKRRLAAGDNAIKPAIDKLRHEADSALDAGPFSVMNKKVVPPSGDKHDYMSMGTYWWPDPDKPDGKPYIRRDGEANPEGGELDHKSLARMGDAVDTLALAWYFTEDPRYAEHAARLLHVWFLDNATRMNPHLEYGQAIPGRCDGRGIGIIDTTTLVRVVDAVGLLESSNAWTNHDHKRLRQWFTEYLAWLIESEHGKDEARQPNNHGTWYDVQVASFALFVGDRDTARETLARRPLRRVAHQIEPDGRQPLELSRTKSFSYSVLNP